MPIHHCVDDLDGPQYSYSQTEAEHCSSRRSPTSVYVYDTDERLPASYASVSRTMSLDRVKENYGKIFPSLSISEVSAASTSKSKSCNSSSSSSSNSNSSSSNSRSSSDTCHSGFKFNYVGSDVAPPMESPFQRSSQCSTSEFRKVQSSLNSYSSVIMSRVADALEKLETNRSEEDVFCEYLKKRLQDLGPYEKRRTIYKLHTVIANELDENGACCVPPNERSLVTATFGDLMKDLGKLQSRVSEITQDIQSEVNEARHRRCYPEDVEVVQDV